MNRTKRRRSRSRRTRRRMRKLTGGCGTCNMKGGSRRKGIMKGMKGGLLKGGLLKGGFVKQDLVNFGRQMSFGASSAYRGLLGLNPPTNPNPLIQPIKTK